MEKIAACPKAKIIGRLAVFVLALGTTVSLKEGPAQAQTPVERGRYLVTMGGCNDCHTPGYFSGKPDQTRVLGGSDVGFLGPDNGTYVGPNLTPDAETGLGYWSADDIVKAIQTGITPEGRELAPMMPWRRFAGLQKSDAYAIAAYLKSLPTVKHQVAGPFGPSEHVTIPVMRVVRPEPPQ
ncbi:c-type cytochrome [Rhizobium leguminosarum]|uniref:c-type cytochrome n=1 Tax=Rhizobium leguminosarum TaxID=384 RepID=UPI00143F9DD2|nr:c-type cytochrome [Rhizobium leguminosarum]NKL23390.1 c-type cytochrome [Rhizobium leguminosarum bv. viciae]